MLKTFNSYELQEQDYHWINSLLKNLKKRGSVNSHFVFLRTDLQLFLNDKPSPITVYVNKDEPEQCLTFKKDGERFIIDFGRKTVYVPCCGGLSFHPDDKGRYVIIVHPVSTEIGGIPISSGGAAPVFKENKVTFY